MNQQAAANMAASLIPVISPSINKRPHPRGSPESSYTKDKLERGRTCENEAPRAPQARPRPHPRPFPSPLPSAGGREGAVTRRQPLTGQARAGTAHWRRQGAPRPPARSWALLGREGRCLRRAQGN